MSMFGYTFPAKITVNRQAYKMVIERFELYGVKLYVVKL